jgi:hypothetical protein
MKTKPVKSCDFYTDLENLYIAAGKVVQSVPYAKAFELKLVKSSSTTNIHTNGGTTNA